MIAEIGKLLVQNGFLPHGYCISWSPPLVGTYVVSDILIFLAYFSMPVALVYFARRRPDFPYRGVLWMFALFIVACGATHLMGTIVLWQPLYWLDAILKAITAAVSVATAIVLWPMIPKALKLPSPAALQAVNEELRREIAERKRMEEQLRIAAVAFQSRDGMLVTDRNGVILQVNRSFTEVTGYSAEEAIGQTLALLHSGRQDANFYRTMWEAIQRESYWQGQIWNRRKDGGIYPEWLAISAIRDESGEITHYFGTFSDISDPLEAERKILELAFYDPLTGLPNRRLLMDRLQQALGNSHRHNQFGALLLLDLDHFKTLNDTRGHDVGDQLLVEVARRLRLALRETDTAARLGGDEFVILLEDMGQAEVAAANTAERVVEKLLATLGQEYVLQGAACHIGASIGIALFHHSAESAEGILKQADLALYQAKGAGRNTSRFYSPAMQAAVDSRAELETGLRRALANDEFMLYYQPQVDGDGHLIGAEALLRWQTPGGKMVSPGEFIPAAEASGLIVPIGNWVLAAACRQIAAWGRSPATRNLRVAVNISAQQFRQPDFVARVHAALEESGADPTRLKLELTESSVVDDIEQVLEWMHTLKSIGVGFSMDDFGTGYSCLANLKRLPLEQLKIDQSFVRDIPADPYDCAIAQAVIGLGNSLRLHVIAEGVETEAQREFLASLGCRAYQGYLFGRPGPAEAIGRFLAGGEARVEAEAG